jgi:hypothetical protein
VQLLVLAFLVRCKLDALSTGELASFAEYPVNTALSPLFVVLNRIALYGNRSTVLPGHSI